MTLRGVSVGDELVRGWTLWSSPPASRRAYSLEMQNLWLVLEVYSDRAPLLGRMRVEREGDGVDLVGYSKDATDYRHLDGAEVSWF